MNITTDDLELLAKTAGVEIYTDGGGRHWRCDNHKAWNPPESRDDVALVVAGLSHGQRLTYDLKLHALWSDTGGVDTLTWVQTLPPETSTKLILEVISVNKTPKS